MDEDKNISPLFAKLYRFKKEVLSHEDHFKGRAEDANHIAILERDDNRIRKVGVFSLKGMSADVKVDLPDGNYTNQLNGNIVAVADGKIICDGEPIVFSVESN